MARRAVNVEQAACRRSHWVTSLPMGRQARHDLSASDPETLTLRDLLAMAMPVDVQRWHALPLGYGDPCGAVWLRQAISETYADANEDTVLCFAGHRTR